MAEEQENKGKKSLNGADPFKLENWRKAINGDEITDQQYHINSGRLGSRARLRRSERPDDALLTQAFSLFLNQVPDRWAKDNHLYVSAMIAVLLSHIETNDTSNQFMAQLAVGEGDRPVMSELRFKQLLKSRDPEEFFKRLLQAIRLLKGKVNTISMIEGILHWYREYQYGPDSNPMNRLSVRWAQQYYEKIK